MPPPSSYLFLLLFIFLFTSCHLSLSVAADRYYIVVANQVTGNAPASYIAPLTTSALFYLGDVGVVAGNGLYIDSNQLNPSFTFSSTIRLASNATYPFQLTWTPATSIPTINVLVDLRTVYASTASTGSQLVCLTSLPCNYQVQVNWGVCDTINHCSTAIKNVFNGWDYTTGLPH